MALFRCKACGAPLEVREGTEVAFCPYCGMKQTLPKDPVQVMSDGTSVDSLLERAFMFLEDGEFAKANEYCDRVLDIEPKSARAYLGKLMADLGVRKQEQLAKSGLCISGNKNYLKAVKFADGTLKATLQELAEKNDEARERFDEESRQRKRDYDTGIKLMHEGKYQEAEIIFGGLPEDYSDTLSRYKECRYNQAVICMKNGEYAKALEILSADFGKTPMSPERFRAYLEREYHGKPAEIERSFRSHLRRFNSKGTYKKDLRNYRDSSEKIKECERMLSPALQQQTRPEKYSGCMTLILQALAAIIIITFLAIQL